MDEKDLALLEQVELRIATAETETAFESQVKNLLCPVLQHLDNKSTKVQQKVLAICGHISKRYKLSSNLQLPLDKLIDLYVGNGGLALKNFALIYLKMGFARISPSVAKDLLPKLVCRIAERPASQQMTLFAIALPFIGVYNDLDTTADDPFQFKKYPADLDFWISGFLKMILYTVPSSGRQVTALNQSSAAPPPSPMDQIPAGMSRTDVEFITHKLSVPWTLSHQAVKEIKISILKFCMVDKVIPKDSNLADKYILGITAMADSAHEVRSLGDNCLKRFARPNFEDEAFILRLYNLYKGSDSTGFNSKSPATTLLKQKIIDALCKSALATNQFPLMIQVAFDALYSDVTNSKLRNSGMMFVQWIARMAQQEKIEPVAPVLLTGLLKLIDEPNTEKNESQRAFGYEAVGLLSKRAPKLFEKDFGLLEKFFDALKTENRNVCVSVQEALVSMAPAYKSSLNIAEFCEKLKEIILDNIDKNETHARYVAINYATRLFTFSDPFARYICLLAASDSKLEIREQAFSGLEFPGEDVISEEDSAIPSLTEMIQTLDKLSTRTRFHIAKVPGVTWIGNVTAETYTYALIFLHQLLIKSIIPEFAVTKITTYLEDKPAWLTGANKKRFQQGLADIFMDIEHIDGIEGFVRFIRAGLDAADGGGQLTSIASFFLLELVAIGPPSLTASLGNSKEWLLSFVGHSKLETKISMSRLLGIICTINTDKSPGLEKLVELVDILLQKAESKVTDERLGGVLSLGFIVGRFVARYTSSCPGFAAIKVDAILLAISKALIDSDKPELHIGACIALAEATRYGPLSDKYFQPEGYVVRMWEKMQQLIKSSNEIKVKEAAIAAAGHLSVCHSIKKEIFDYFMALANVLSKQPEIHFNVGESICASLFGFRSSHMEEYLDIGVVIAEKDEELVFVDPFADESISKILSYVVPSQNAVTKKAACIWLLCVTKFCGNVSSIKPQLLKFHQAFSSLLADKDDFTQEIASKGIGLIYEIGDQNLRNELVGALVSTFTEGKKIAAQSVNNDTQLFAGDIGATPDGGNLNTYQSILSLAADMNQPDLVYKFMSLASHHQIWNSRRGASMGFGSIAQQAEKELIPHLPKLVPRLYRYQFDPHPKTAQGMKNIWRSLVKDPVKSIEQFFDQIMAEVLKGMGDRMWRTREASCSALADLLHGKQLHQVQKYMTELWTMCFRTLDDIKESVRKAAFQTCKTLTNLTVRYANPNSSNLSNSQKVMDEMIPFLLEKGLVNMAEEVRQFSLATILKLCKTGGALLRPHVTNITCTFLESLSSLEPQTMNYLSLNADKYNISQDMLDSTRLSAAKASPIMDAVDQCVQFIDSKSLEDLIPRLCSIIKRGIGLPTRAGTARFIYILIQKMPMDIRSHADVLVKALTGPIFDRSPPVRKSFSTALGHVCKLASAEAIDRLTNHLQTTYLEATEEDGRSVAPVTFLEMSRLAPTAVSEIHGVLLPLAFMGARDTTFPTLADIWAKVWEENTGGSTNAIKKWKKEIFDSMSVVLKTSPSWALKKQVGKGLVDFSKALGTDVNDFVPPMLSLLVDSLGGRTWDGKEALVEALCTLVVEAKLYFASHQTEKVLVEDIFIREAKKNNINYRRLTIEYLGIAFDSLESERFSDCFPYLCEVAEDLVEKDDELDDAIQKPMMLVVRGNAFKAIGYCFSTAGKNMELADAAGTFVGKNLVNQVWNIRIAILQGLTKFLSKINRPSSPDALHAMVTGLLACLSDTKYRSVRDHAVKCLESLIGSIGGVGGLNLSQLDSLKALALQERDNALQHDLKKILKLEI